MRILFCNWKDRLHPAAGGAEVYADECARRWTAAGHHVTLTGGAVDGEPEVDERCGYRVIRSGTRIGVYRKVADHLRAYGHSYDVIIDGINTRPFFAPKHAPATPVVALAHQVAREVWFRETPLPVALAGRYVFEPRWLARYRDVPTLTISHSSLMSLRSYGLRNLSIVPVGVTLPGDPADGIVAGRGPGAAPLDPDRGPADGSAPAPGLRLVFCGRLTPGKRPFDAIEAFTAAATALGLRPGVDATLDVIGGGPLEGDLVRAAVPGVVVHGVVDEATKFELMGRAHALLATSTREGWGLVVSEAAAAGTPTIGYDVGGLRDSITAAGGIVVTPTPTHLADALIAALPRIMSRPPAPRPWGGAASWDHTAAVVLEHLERAAGRRSVRVRPATPMLVDVRDVALIDVRGVTRSEPGTASTNEPDRVDGVGGRDGVDTLDEVVLVDGVGAAGPGAGR